MPHDDIASENIFENGLLWVKMKRGYSVQWTAHWRHGHCSIVRANPRSDRWHIEVTDSRRPYGDNEMSWPVESLEDGMAKACQFIERVQYSAIEPPPDRA